MPPWQTPPWCTTGVALTWVQVPPARTWRFWLKNTDQGSLLQLYLPVCPQDW